METLKLCATYLLMFLLTVGVALFLLNQIFKVQRDLREPPFIEPKLPFIGHVLGLASKKTEYYVELSKKSKLRIYGLLMPGMAGNRVYVINSPDLVVAVQRQHTVLSFWSVAAAFTAQLAGLSSYAEKTFVDNSHGEEWKPSLMRAEMENAHASFRSGGEFLAPLQITALEILAPSIGKLEAQIGETLELKRLVGDGMMASVTRSIFGVKNPFEDPSVGKDFEELEDNALGLMSLPFPRITAKKAYFCRERIVTAFKKYYDTNGQDTASHYTQEQSKIHSAYGFSNQDKARLDTANSHAFLANTTPTAFWTIYHIISDPRILQDVRDAILPLVTVKSINGVKSFEMNVTHITEIPVLRSVLHECLRHYGNGAGARVVTEDTLLENKYLLKKNSFVFMPNRSYHFDPTSWGPTVNEFDSYRFTRSKAPSGAFRGFGGGVNLCPGRFFCYEWDFSNVCYVDNPIQLQAFRIYARAILIRSLGHDDYVCILAAIGSTVHSSFMIYNTGKGYGAHLWDIRAISLTPQTLRDLSAMAIIYPLAMLLVKLTISLLYLRLFSLHKTFRNLVYGQMSVSVAFYTGLTIWQIYELLHCTTATSLSSKVCAVNAEVNLACACFNVATDFFLFALPVPIVMGLQMRNSKKMGLLAIFGAGFSATVVSLVRMILIAKDLHNPDLLYIAAYTSILTVVEINVGIIAASMSSLPIALKKGKPFFDNTLQSLQSNLLFTRSNRSKTSYESDHRSAASKPTEEFIPLEG
ncbi:hypothetical protein G7Y89_g9155 [Cudoniella acicularis]|uniref:Rhodopsin domain-containing protein n=1 Tax=Cudoniella acicularis TaxID=354080 RepID=A0A8H4RGS0_9HELO|nr:hypothetical protein G7Y89_g9155 [Cudoniella acicularis]